MGHVTEGDLTQVAAVAEDAEHYLGGETPATAGPQFVGVQLGGDGGRSGPALAVAGEDSLDDRELGRLDGQVLVLVQAQTVGDPSTGPATP